MDKYNLKVTNSERAVFRRLTIRTGEWMSQRAIAKETRLTPTSVGRAITILKKQGHVSMRTEGPSNLVTLNQENPVTVARKRVENLALLNESGIVESLEQHHKGSTIILFGSYARGEDTIKSDIDIAIIGAKQDSTDTATYEKYLERPINIQTYKDKKAIDSFVQTNIHNGIILSGGWQ